MNGRQLGADQPPAGRWGQTNPSSHAGAWNQTTSSTLLVSLIAMKGEAQTCQHLRQSVLISPGSHAHGEVGDGKVTVRLQ